MVSNSSEESLDKYLISRHEKETEKQSMNEAMPRVINPQAEKILDAPDIKDDYYLNLLDWSSKGVLAIGLAERVYLYSPKEITELCVQN